MNKTPERLADIAADISCDAYRLKNPTPEQLSAHRERFRAVMLKQFKRQKRGGWGYYAENPEQYYQT